MTDWDAPARTRSFLAAALLTAVCGIVFSTQEPTPRLSVAGDVPRPALSRSNSWDFSEEPGAQEGLDPEVTQAAFFDDESSEDSQLRDAVAAGGPSAAQLAAGPAGASGAWIAAGRSAAAPRGLAPSGYEARRAAEALRSLNGQGKGKEKETRAARGPAAGAADAVLSTIGSFASALAGDFRPRPGLTSSVSSARAEPSAKDSSARSPLSQNGRPAAKSSSSAAADAASTPASSSSGSARSFPRLAKLKPILMSKLLGPRPIRPPRGAIKPPERNPWTTPLPRPGLQPISVREAEKLAPPDSGCRKAGPHWHDQADFHNKDLRGRLTNGRWAWFQRSGERTWLWPAPGGPALLSHEGRWWWQSRGVWFLLHDGEPWGWRYLAEWRQEGLVHGSGAQMIYSADAKRVGLVAPGEGAILFDSTTGAELGRWSAEQLPKKPAPKAPTRLRLP